MRKVRSYKSLHVPLQTAFNTSQALGGLNCNIAVCLSLVSHASWTLKNPLLLS
jgi:hypothetical protein